MRATFHKDFSLHDISCRWRACPWRVLIWHRFWIFHAWLPRCCGLLCNPALLFCCNIAVVTVAVLLCAFQKSWALIVQKSACCECVSVLFRGQPDFSLSMLHVSISVVITELIYQDQEPDSLFIVLASRACCDSLSEHLLIVLQ